MELSSSGLLHSSFRATLFSARAIRTCTVLRAGIFDVPDVLVLEGVDLAASAYRCCYTVDGLRLLSELLLCDAAQRTFLLEAALAPDNPTRRASAKDLTRGITATKFVSDILPDFALNARGLVCFATAAAAAGSTASEQLLLPREFVVHVASTAAATLHADQSSTGKRYDGTVSADGVFKLLKEAGYWVGHRRVGSTTLNCVKEILQTQLFCRPVTGWSEVDAGSSGVWLPRTLALLGQSRAVALKDSRLTAWLATLPPQWVRVGAAFPELRSFQVSAGPAALILPKSELAGRDSILKALGVDARSSIVTRGIHYVAGSLSWRYECVRAGDPAAMEKKGSNKSKAALSKPSGLGTQAAVDALDVLHSLGAQPDNDAARALVADLSAAAIDHPLPPRSSLAAAVGADPGSCDEATSSIACKCQYRVWVIWPVVGRLALVVTSGGHSGHTLRSEDDKKHLSLPPIVEELLVESQNNPGGITVNLTERASLAGQRQQIHRERAAVRRLHGWARGSALRGLTAHSTYSSPSRPRGKHGHFSELRELVTSTDGGGGARVLTMLTQNAEAEADSTRCGLCRLDTAAAEGVEHCSQCCSVYHITCIRDGSDHDMSSSQAAMSDDQWVCRQCRSQNAADDNAAPPGLLPTSSRAAGWLPPPLGVVCPGSLLTQPQAEYLRNVFKLSSVGHRFQESVSVTCQSSGLPVGDASSTQPPCRSYGVSESKGQEEGDFTDMPGLVPALRQAPAISPSVGGACVKTTDSDVLLVELPPDPAATPNVASATSTQSETPAASVFDTTAPQVFPKPWEFASSLTGLPYRVACYAMPTDSLVSNLRNSLQRRARNGSTVADDTLQTLQRLCDLGWAVVRPAAGSAKVDSALKNLCAFIMSDDMRAFVEAEKARSALSLRIRICDATFSIGNHDLQLFGMLSIDAETGIAVPVAWFIVGKPVDTAAIAWCFEQCAVAGIPPAFVTMFDKDVKEFNAVAQVAGSRWHSDDGLAARAESLEALAPLAQAADAKLIHLASSVLDRTPGGLLYTSRMLPPKPSELPGFAALGSLSPAEEDAARLIFKPELLGYGRVLLGLARLLHDCILSREVSRDTDYDDWHTAMRPLLPFSHFVQVDGPLRRFLDDYCLVFALLCVFHVKQALTKNILAKRGSANAAQRKQIVAEFIEFVETAPVMGWEPQYAAYKARWEGIVDASWWVYLEGEWLCSKWRRLLLSSERDIFARLYIETTNGIELVWRVFKYDWLLHRRVSAYATAFRLLFGLPWERDSAFLSLTGRVLFTLMQIRSGIARPPLRRRIQAMIDQVTPLLLRADADKRFLRRDSTNPCWYAISSTSYQFASARTHEQPLHDSWTVHRDHPSAVTLLTDAQLIEEHGRSDSAAVSSAVLQVQRVASGAAAAEMRVALRRAGVAGSVHRWNQPASSCDDALGAILPAIAGPEDAARRFEVVRTLVDAANASGFARHSCDSAQRGFECLRSSGRSTGQSKASIISQGEIVLQYINPTVFEGIVAFMPHRRAISYDDRANNTARVASSLVASWPMTACSDYPRGATTPPGLDFVPRVCLVYAVLYFAAVSVWLEECERLFVRHETRSRVFPSAVPDGYLALLFEVWGLLKFLQDSGRGGEEFMIPYIGKERHEESVPFTRSRACGTTAGCTNAIHIQHVVGRGSARRVISPLGAVRRVDRMLAVLPLDCPLALNMAETLSMAFFAGSGVSCLNNGPTGNKRGMLDARGSYEATDDILVRERIRDWGITGCTSSTVADEPSYWLRRLLAPWEHKWVSGLHLGVPPRHVEARVDDAEFRPPGGVTSGRALSSNHEIALPVPALTVHGVSSRYVILEADIPQQKQCTKPSWLQVVESWRNPDKDGAVVYEFCLWCNACNCPSSGCVCKHVLAGRIDHLREGNPAAWSDALLSPITRGRERTLYTRHGQSGAEVVATLRDDCGDDSLSDSSDEESAAPPRSILRSMPLADAQPTLASMLALQSRAQSRPAVRPGIAISCILADLEAMHGTWSNIETLCQSDSSVLSVAQLRSIELAALSARKEHERATKLVNSLSGDGGKVGGLRRGLMLAPLRSAGEGDAQAKRFQPLGHPMYLSTSCGLSVHAETAIADGIETTPRSLAVAQSPRQTGLAGSRCRLEPLGQPAACTATGDSACAFTPPSPRHDSAGTDASLRGDAEGRGRRHTDGIATARQGKGSSTLRQLPTPSATGGSSTLAADQLSCADTACPPGPLRQATDSSEHFELSIGAAIDSDLHPVMSRGSGLRHPTHHTVANAGQTSAVTKLGKRDRRDTPSQTDRDRWLNRTRSFLLPSQSVRLPRRAGTLAQHYDGVYVCMCCDQSGWAPATDYDPAFFMQCANCDDVAAGGVPHLA